LFPFYSVDSTTPISTCMYGLVYVNKLKTFSKRKMVREKRPELLIDKEAKIERAVYYTKLREQYFTELWAKRGVKWNE